MKIQCTVALLATLVIGSAAWADEEEGPPQGPFALLEKLVEKFDADKSGQLERAECELAVLALRDRKKLQDRGVPAALDEREVTAMFDFDGNQMIDASEKLAFAQAIDGILGDGAYKIIAAGSQDGGAQGGGDGRPSLRGLGAPRGFGGFSRGGSRGRGGFGRGGGGRRGR
jgi:hypothetical protein